MCVSVGLLVWNIKKPSVVRRKRVMRKERGGQLSEHRCKLIIEPEASVCLYSP